MDAPGLRERKKVRTRRSIQDAALRLFAEQGYDATTVDQIAEAADISPSTFFRYFPTKEDTVFADEYDPLLVAAIESQPADATPIEAVRGALRTTFAAIFEADKDTLLQRMQLTLRTPALRSRAFDNTRQAEELLAEAVAVRTGRPASDLTVRMLTAAAVAVMMQALEAWVDGDGENNLPAMMDHGLGQLESGFQLD